MGSRRQNGAGEVVLGGSHAGWRNECGLHGLVCYNYDHDSSSIMDASRNTFLTLVVAWASCVVCAYGARRGNSKRWSLYWTGSLCVLVCSVQAYYLYQAANTIPASYNKDKTFRFDCLDSTKGGKLSKISDKNRPEDGRNPCFCHEFAQCTDRAGRNITPSVDCP